MRKSFNGLIAIASQQMKMDPTSGHLFIFVNRKRTLLKALYFETHGYCIWHKRLEVGQFNFQPGSHHESISQTEFHALIEGIKIKKIRNYKRSSQ